MVIIFIILFSIRAVIIIVFWNIQVLRHHTSLLNYVIFSSYIWDKGLSIKNLGFQSSVYQLGSKTARVFSHKQANSIDFRAVGLREVAVET